MNIIDSIFNPLKDTIFSKMDSNLEKQLEELKKISENNKSVELAKDIKLLELGIKGEKEIENVYGL